MKRLASDDPSQVCSMLPPTCTRPKSPLVPSAAATAPPKPQITNGEMPHRALWAPLLQLAIPPALVLGAPLPHCGRPPPSPPRLTVKPPRASSLPLLSRPASRPLFQQGVGGAPQLARLPRIDGRESIPTPIPFPFLVTMGTSK